MDHKRLINTEKELIEDLSTPLKWIDSETGTGKFDDLAFALLNNFQIQKGDNRYWMTDIEFYIYTDSHRDIITYPRNCGAGRWFFHPSGVDISFESEVDPEARIFVKKPKLTESSVFGGILIRGIVMEGNPLVNPDGPIKVCDELFDHFNAFDSLDNFPKIVPANSKRTVSIKCEKRVGMKEKGETKVPKILKNYESTQIPREELIKAHNLYQQESYRFKVK